jgi:hypothetical protein
MATYLIQTEPICHPDRVTDQHPCLPVLRTGNHLLLFLGAGRDERHSGLDELLGRVVRAAGDLLSWKILGQQEDAFNQTDCRRCSLKVHLTQDTLNVTA